MSQSIKRTAQDFEQLPIMFGCDPELFLFDTITNKYISAHPYIPGNKRTPHQLPRGGTVQLDGLACEIGIPPSTTRRDFEFNVLNTIADVKELLPKNVILKATPSAWFDAEYFDKEVPDHCKELGCDPDFDAYQNGARNPRPNGRIEKDGKVLRTGAGHIHISWGEGFDIDDEQHRWNCLVLTRSLDKLLLPMSTLWDKDTTRATMYGKPGTYRPKSYGMEYRALSNAWLQDRRYLRCVIDNTRILFSQLFQTGKEIENLYVYNRDYDYSYMQPRYKEFNLKNLQTESYVYLTKEGGAGLPLFHLSTTVAEPLVSG